MRITTTNQSTDVSLFAGGPGGGFNDAMATWQGGAGVVTPSLGCPAATPTRDRTWGELKAFYR